MKIAVFSDTHGSARGMISAVSSYSPDAVIHLGDGNSDLLKLSREFPALPVFAVRGNCDHDGAAPETLCADLGGISAFLTHGHLYGVRYGDLNRLLYTVESEGAKIAMFGHTHRAGYDWLGGVFVLNPGTAGVGSNRTWAKLEIDSGRIVSCSIENIVLT